MLVNPITILIVSLNYAPAHNSHCRALGEPLRALGYNVKYLLSSSLAWTVPRAQMEHVVFMGSSQNGLEILKDTVNFLIYQRQHLFQFLAQIKPSLVLFESSHPINNFIAHIIRTDFAGTRIWMLLHEPYVSEKLKHGFRKSILIVAHELLTKHILKNLDGVLVPSDEALRQFQKAYIDFKGVVLKVPLLFEDRVRPGSFERHYFSYIGHAGPEKGTDIFFKLVRASASAGNEWKFQIVSSSDISNYFSRLPASAQEQLRVVNKPKISDEEIDEAVRRSWAVLAPHRRVTQSGVVPVAFMHGTPVISTNVGGMSEWVIHGKTGYLLSLDASFSEWENAFYFVQSNFAYLSANCRRFFLENFDARHSPEFLRPMLDSIGASS